jgi:hypothetical protein
VLGVGPVLGAVLQTLLRVWVVGTVLGCGLATPLRNVLHLTQVLGPKKHPSARCLSAFGVGPKGAAWAWVGAWAWVANMEYKKSHTGDDSRTRLKSSTLGQDAKKYFNLKSRCHK